MDRLLNTEIFRDTYEMEEAERRLKDLEIEGKIALLREYWVDGLDDIVDELIHVIPEERRYEVYELDDYGVGEKI